MQTYLCNMSNRSHWEKIYQTKNTNQLSWTQDVPEISMNLILACSLPKTSKIIDVGGGESNLVDFLLEAGYLNITVLDISEESIKRAKKRLGQSADKVTWVVQNITEYETDQTYDCWHDRAAFHFLTNPEQISTYARLAKKFTNSNGYLIVGTFSENGPEKCSGLPITRYNENGLSREFEDGFKKLNCITQDHETPFHTKQNFIYCSFKKI